MFHFCDTHLEVSLMCTNMHHLELTPESYKVKIFKSTPPLNFGTINNRTFCVSFSTKVIVEEFKKKKVLIPPRSWPIRSTLCLAESAKLCQKSRYKLLGGKVLRKRGPTKKEKKKYPSKYFRNPSLNYLANVEFQMRNRTLHG